MQSNEAIARFDLALESMISKLNRYSNSAQAKPGYIKAEEARIKEFVEIRNSFEKAGNIAVWGVANTKMEELKRLDPTINGFVIELSGGDMPKRQGHITIPISL